jgi:ABC-2 type transport system ATP-binding protein
MYSINIENLTKKYSGVEVLKNVSLRVEEGEFYCLMGPNGSGKTTLTSILASVKMQTSGKVEIYDKHPSEARSLMGYMPQENFSSTSLTGMENLVYFAGLLGYPDKESKKIAGELLLKVGLSNEANKMVSKYSGGMRKRLELATIFFSGIKILILDEPTTGLDPSARRNFFSLINEIKSRDTTIFLITHIGADAELASKVGLINKGEIVAEGNPEELKKASNLKNSITIETRYKDDKIKEILANFNEEKEVLETENGYKIFNDDIADIIPNIIRSIDKEDNKVTRLESTSSTLEDLFFKLTSQPVRESVK